MVTDSRMIFVIAFCCFLSLNIKSQQISRHARYIYMSCIDKELVVAFRFFNSTEDVHISNTIDYRFAQCTVFIVR